jgi:hypothetical protein
MKKISTLFKKNPNDLGKVINEINLENSWVFDDGVVATRKWDGTACAIIKGILCKRYDVKKGKSVPENAIPCQQPDEITGHWPHWIQCFREDNSNKWHFEAFDKMSSDQKIDGTYELCGPKIQDNPEKLYSHELIEHGNDTLPIVSMCIDFDIIKTYLTKYDIEGIVFHHPDGRMCKIRKSDFGIKR